jgi:agmatine deiminase
VLAPRQQYWISDLETFAPCYLNSYVANGAVIGPSSGDAERDEAAREALAETFPEREISWFGLITSPAGVVGFTA